MANDDKGISGQQRAALAEFFGSQLIKGDPVAADFPWERLKSLHVYKVREEGRGTHMSVQLTMDEIVLYDCDVQAAVAALYGGTESGVWRVGVPDPLKPSRHLAMRDVEVDPDMPRGPKFGGPVTIERPAAANGGGREATDVARVVSDRFGQVIENLQRQIEGMQATITTALQRPREEPSAIQAIVEASAHSTRELVAAQAEAARIRAEADRTEREARADLERRRFELEARLEEQRLRIEEDERKRRLEIEDSRRRAEDDALRIREEAEEARTAAIERLASAPVASAPAGGGLADMVAQIDAVEQLRERLRGDEPKNGRRGDRDGDDDETGEGDDALSKGIKLAREFRELMRESRTTPGAEQPAATPARQLPAGSGTAKRDATASAVLDLAVKSFSRGTSARAVAAMIEGRKSKIRADEWDALMQADGPAVEAFVRTTVEGASDALVRYCQKVVRVLQAGGAQAPPARREWPVAPPPVTGSTATNGAGAASSASAASAAPFEVPLGRAG